MATHATETFLRQLRRIVLFGTGAGPTDASLLGRFIDKRDEEAFEGLIRRHGPMVLGVCRRLLSNQQDAEDAFQATFLVLVRKATSVRPRAMVGNWLYGVAHQTAIRVRALNAKKRTREQQMPIMPEPQAAPSSAHEELRRWLDHALSQLPDKYRAAVVACDLEGKTRDEAARELGWPIGSLSSRLSRGRALLAKRLAKHGPAFSVGLLAAELSQSASATSVPPTVLVNTIKAASLFAAGQMATAGALSAKVVAVAEGMIRIMNLTKWATTSVAIFVLAALGTGLGWGGYQLMQVDAQAPQAVAGEKKADVNAKKPAEPTAALKTDKDRIVGVWRPKGYEEEGQDAPLHAEDYNRFTVTKDGKWIMAVFNSPNNSHSWSFDYKFVGPDKIDLHATTTVMRLLYRFDGDNRLTVCQSRHGNDLRPTEFTTDIGDNRILYRLVRAKPGEETPTQEELDKSKAALKQFVEGRKPVQLPPRKVSWNNLRDIALAFHNYDDTHRSLPAHALYSADVKTPLLSWRVAILPFLDEQAIYYQFKLDEPWDSEHNKKLIPKMPKVYSSPVAGRGEPGKTFYQVVTGPSTLFDGAKKMQFKDIVDGASKTLLVVEAKEPVIWTKPDDLTLPADKDQRLAVGGLFANGFHAAIADASVEFLTGAMPTATLRAIVTPRGQEAIDLKLLRATPKD